MPICSQSKKYVNREKVVVNLDYLKGLLKWFPAVVVKRIGNIIYLVKINHGEIKKVNESQLKVKSFNMEIWKFYNRSFIIEVYIVLCLQFFITLKY